MKKVALYRCDEYLLADVKVALTKAIEDLGGLDKYFTKGEKILFKVNLLMKKTPEEATTTHPVFVMALAEIFIEAGLEVLIGDSPGGPFNNAIVKPIYKASGMEEAAEKTGAKLNFNYGSFEKNNLNGMILKKITLTDMLNDVDKIISISKLKTHAMMTFTGAVKNMFGAIPGVLKAEYHLNMPEKDDFANALIDICNCVNPTLSFMDGIMAMEGAGPSAGNPRKLGVILASESPYALDKAACSIINLPFENVPILRQAVKRGITTADLSDAEISGHEIKEFLTEDFVIPLGRELNPLRKLKLKFASKFFDKALQPYPVFVKKDCIGCEICAKNCPAKTIEMAENKAYVDLENCIRCFCCQELCPKKAIIIKQPFLLKIVMGKFGQKAVEIWLKNKGRG